MLHLSFIAGSSVYSVLFSQLLWRMSVWLHQSSRRRGLIIQLPWMPSSFWTRINHVWALPWPTHLVRSKRVDIRQSLIGRKRRNWWLAQPTSLLPGPSSETEWQRWCPSCKRRSWYRQSMVEFWNVRYPRHFVCYCRCHGRSISKKLMKRISLW